MADYECRLEGMEELLAELERQQKSKAIPKLIRKRTAKLQERSMSLCPVRTGNLKRSCQIFVEDGGLTGRVTFGNALCNYAQYVEFGTRFQYPQKYLGRAFRTQQFMLIRDMKELVK
ncbi:HK97 gp10 family phage protein [Lactobacillus jensenii]|uniref:HK97 gp10 family phage protein n=1 Tax=Lactobacillus mulieris TaxID=2508708 RepID=A0AAP3M443_9LACO|nr:MULTISPECIES: HK97-gp10 family putative phage morphogenesis protein [Lactobacillus]MCW8089871.1 HK97 gp10 family phage protein [Lactobacillus jensenii]MCZ3845166.1 HK97 gp10 family phage protein [Lactobacillus mulieris]MCZ3900394.1 HK97 gp10 family phage protein [Lactobacillus mulieris]MDK6563823.1 HK97 gp10 family phage protein [Lactobacillus mulieris]MDK8082836.1 HK97 gp10 family phage protein [Lactobacillus mulieris]